MIRLEGYRKMIFAALIIVLSFVLVQTGHLDSDGFSRVVQWTAMAFGLGNAGEWVGRGVGAQRAGKG